MTVTKQQQLEWLAKEFAIWPGFRGIAVRMSNIALGVSGDGHAITREEWQQERDKMQKQGEKADSWHERGELPPVGCECNYVTGISCVQVRIQGAGHVDGYPVAFFVMKDSWCTATTEFFRPLRTEREKAIDGMMSLVVDGLMSHEMAKELVIKLHDAGYRKVSQ